MSMSVINWQNNFVYMISCSDDSFNVSSLEPLTSMNSRIQEIYNIFSKKDNTNYPKFEFEPSSWSHLLFSACSVDLMKRIASTLLKCPVNDIMKQLDLFFKMLQRVCLVKEIYPLVRAVCYRNN